MSKDKLMIKLRYSKIAFCNQLMIVYRTDVI